MDPITDSRAWDTFLLAGQPSPGLCTSVAGATNPRKWDEKKGAGLSGSGIVYQGDGLAQFTVELLLWEPDHFAHWDEWKKLLAPPTEARPEALDAFHPQLALLPVPITSVVVDEAGAPEPSGDDTWKVQIKFRQYRKPTPARAKPQGSVSSSSPSGDDVTSPQNANKQRIDELRQEFDELANRGKK